MKRAIFCLFALFCLNAMAQDAYYYYRGAKVPLKVVEGKAAHTVSGARGVAPCSSSIRSARKVGKDFRNDDQNFLYDVTKEYGLWNYYFGYGVVDAYNAVLLTPVY